ncbi:MAG: N-acyl-D-amino-acid deacylase [Saprospiraceae bacterium]|jgi:N-acyl-D-amino-acid deacylase
MNTQVITSFWQGTLLIGLLSLSSCSQNITYDVLINNIEVFDGDGDESYRGNVAIKDNTIYLKNISRKTKALKIIDGNGLAIAPGFIDVHAHLEPIEIFPQAESAIRMGCTTALGGPDGSSPVDMGKYLDTLQSIGTGINVAFLVGHNSVRMEVMGLENHPPSKEEIEAMSNRIEEAMKDGVFGISTGLKYLPGTWAEFDEIVTLSKVASKYGGIYTSHLREEGLGLFAGVQEAINIAEQADIPVVLTHHKAIGLPMWGSSDSTLAMVVSARKRGLDVMVDQYPYTASYTGLSVLIPPWSMVGGKYDKFAERVADPLLRDSIKRGIIFNIMNDRGGGDLKRIQLAKFDWKPELEGKTLYDWAVKEGLEPNAENGADLIIEAQLHRGASAIYHAISPEDVKNIMAGPHTMIASDGRITEFKKGFPHPRVYGTFPRVIGHYARDEGVLPMHVAIQKMTSMPADRLGLKDRGRIADGFKADLVIFNPMTIIDKATFEQPHQYPEGIEYVIINGEFVLEQGQFNDLRSGVVLRGPGYGME